MSVTALAFSALFVAGCLMALSRHAIYGLLTYIAVFYVHPPSRWWGQGWLIDVRWSLLAAGVTLLALILRGRSGSFGLAFRSGAVRAFLLFIVWIAIGSLWAIDTEAHFDLLSYYLKFVLVIAMIVGCVDSERHLRWFLYAHVTGCFYLGWLAFWSFSGGRLDGVGGPGIDEANAAALQMATGILVAGSLFLSGSRRAKAALLLMIPIMVNGLVTTISRSGFLALGLGGLVYNFFTPKVYKRPVRVLSVLAVILFAMLAHEQFWERISTIKYKGQDVVGVDTGGGRLEILRAQWQMFLEHPLGCGSACTAALSPFYLEERFLTEGARASHNTFMTMLVNHGVIGGVFYVAMLVWIIHKLRVLGGRVKHGSAFLAAVLPAVAAALGAIFVGDLFVQYPRLEVRFWFIALLIVLLHLTRQYPSDGRLS